MSRFTSSLPSRGPRGLHRPSLHLLSLAVLALALLAPAAPARAQGGGSALPGLEGGSLTEAELLEGGTTIVIFWASWSPRCRDIFERSDAIAADWKGRARVVTVNFQEELPEIRAFLRGQTVKVPVYRDPDGRFAKKHSVTTLPSMLIYREGRIVFEGGLPSDTHRVIADAVEAP
jgi:thiol-disulfide isomerase/thioredoxin